MADARRMRSLKPGCMLIFTAIRKRPRERKRKSTNSCPEGGDTNRPANTESMIGA